MLDDLVAHAGGSRALTPPKIGPGQDAGLRADGKVAFLMGKRTYAPE
ncbi:hypothetical protein ACFLXE_07645 [Chloroflexota bacterium]